MLSACNVSTIVVCLCSIEPLARNSLLCSRAVMEVAKKVVTVMEAARKDVDKPKELTSTNHAHKRMQRFGWDCSCPRGLRQV